MTPIELKIKAAEISENIITHDIPGYVLSNPDKFEKELLIEVANYLEFRCKLPDISPEWFEFRNSLVAPPKISIEQSSSSFTAIFKADLYSGVSGADLTGGLGVDSYYLSKSFNIFYYVEKNPDLFDVVKHNFEKLNTQNIDFHNTSAESFLDNFTDKLDFVYLDPARRDRNNKKIVSIADCEPNLLALKSSIFKISNLILVKYSPMLDIKMAIMELENIHKIYVISIKNEVKELLFEIRPSIVKSPKVVCINQLSNLSVSSYTFDYLSEENANSTFSLPQKYLFEPNASIMKAGAFKSLCSSFNLNKLAPNSHLYTSNEKPKDFPGRSFTIQNITKYNKKDILSKLKDNKANVACRNFPLKPEVIKKQLNIKDGGEDYLFFTENIKKEKIVLFCKKI